MLTVLRELCECAICLSLVAEPRALPRCGHSFCGSCINNWLARASTWPACRAPVGRGGAERSSALMNTMWHAVRPLLPVAEREDWLQRRSTYHQAICGEILDARRAAAGEAARTPDVLRVVHVRWEVGAPPVDAAVQA